MWKVWCCAQGKGNFSYHAQLMGTIVLTLAQIQTLHACILFGMYFFLLFQSTKGLTYSSFGIPIG